MPATPDMFEDSPALPDLIRDGALFFVSHSGGKDSQAMYAELCGLIPHDQIVVVHAHLGRMEWPGVIDHIEQNIHHPLHVVKAIWKDGSEKTLLGMVERRLQDRPESPCWPSAAMRYCTSDLKRGPIHKFIRQTCKTRGATMAVNCTGMRAEESASRAKLSEWDICKRLTPGKKDRNGTFVPNGTRLVYEWRPIHAWDTNQVFSRIRAAGQEPFWAYQNNERLSCMFCILGSENDLRHAAGHNPELASEYIEIERRSGYSMFHNKTLESIIATDAEAA